MVSGYINKANARIFSVFNSVKPALRRIFGMRHSKYLLVHFLNQAARWRRIARQTTSTNSSSRIRLIRRCRRLRRRARRSRARIRRLRHTHRYHSLSVKARQKVEAAYQYLLRGRKTILAIRKQRNIRKINGKARRIKYANSRKIKQRVATVQKINIQQKAVRRSRRWLRRAVSSESRRHGIQMPPGVVQMRRHWKIRRTIGVLLTNSIYRRRLRRRVKKLYVRYLRYWSRRRQLTRKKIKRVFWLGRRYLWAYFKHTKLYENNPEYLRAQPSAKHKFLKMHNGLFSNFARQRCDINIKSIRQSINCKKRVVRNKRRMPYAFWYNFLHRTGGYKLPAFYGASRANLYVWHEKKNSKPQNHKRPIVKKKYPRASKSKNIRLRTLHKRIRTCVRQSWRQQRKFKMLRSRQQRRYMAKIWRRRTHQSKKRKRRVWRLIVKKRRQYSCMRVRSGKRVRKRWKKAQQARLKIFRTFLAFMSRLKKCVRDQSRTRKTSDVGVQLHTGHTVISSLYRTSSYWTNTTQRLHNSVNDHLRWRKWSPPLLTHRRAAWRSHANNLFYLCALGQQKKLPTTWLPTLLFTANSRAYLVRSMQPKNQYVGVKQQPLRYRISAPKLSIGSRIWQQRQAPRAFNFYSENPRRFFNLRMQRRAVCGGAVYVPTESKLTHRAAIKNYKKLHLYDGVNVAHFNARLPAMLNRKIMLKSDYSLQQRFYLFAGRYVSSDSFHSVKHMYWSRAVGFSHPCLFLKRTYCTSPDVIKRGRQKNNATRYVKFINVKKRRRAAKQKSEPHRFTRRARRRFFARKRRPRRWMLFFRWRKVQRQIGATRMYDALYRVPYRNYEAGTGTVISVNKNFREDFYTFRINLRRRWHRMVDARQRWRRAVKKVISWVDIKTRRALRRGSVAAFRGCLLSRLLRTYGRKPLWQHIFHVYNKKARWRQHRAWSTKQRRFFKFRGMRKLRYDYSHTAAAKLIKNTINIAATLPAVHRLVTSARSAPVRRDSVLRSFGALVYLLRANTRSRTSYIKTAFYADSNWRNSLRKCKAGHGLARVMVSQRSRSKRKKLRHKHRQHPKIFNTICEYKRTRSRMTRKYRRRTAYKLKNLIIPKYDPNTLIAKLPFNKSKNTQHDRQVSCVVEQKFLVYSNLKMRARRKIRTRLKSLLRILRATRGKIRAYSFVRQLASTNRNNQRRQRFFWIRRGWRAIVWHHVRDYELRDRMRVSTAAQRRSRIFSSVTSPGRFMYTGRHSQRRHKKPVHRRKTQEYIHLVYRLQSKSRQRTWLLSWRWLKRAKIFYKKIHATTLALRNSKNAVIRARKFKQRRIPAAWRSYKNFGGWPIEQLLVEHRLVQSNFTARIGRQHACITARAKVGRALTPTRISASMSWSFNYHRLYTLLLYFGSGQKRWAHKALLRILTLRTRQTQCGKFFFLLRLCRQQVSTRTNLFAAFFNYVSKTSKKTKRDA